MKINKLRLVDFRNYPEIDIEFDSGMNVIYGDNAVGKTNIVEAIYFLSLAKSFRTNEDRELIRFKQEFSIVEGDISSSDEKHNLKIIISKNGKKIEKDGYKVNRLSELSGTFINVLFTPEDVNLFKDSPGTRRRLLDIYLSTIYPTYLKSLMEYKKILSERNALLKQDTVDEMYLDILTERMMIPSYEIQKARIKLIEELNSLIVGVASKIDEDKKIKIIYQPSLKFDEDYEMFKLNNLNKFKENREEELKRKSTLLGIQRDDFTTYLDDKYISLYGSQGQNRIVSILIKLSFAELIEEKLNIKPVIILDDVLSELDDSHQTKLINILKGYEQIFITCARKEINEENITYYEVSDNKVFRRY